MIVLAEAVGAAVQAGCRSAAVDQAVDAVASPCRCNASAHHKLCIRTGSTPHAHVLLKGPRVGQGRQAGGCHCPGWPLTAGVPHSAASLLPQRHPAIAVGVVQLEDGVQRGIRDKAHVTTDHVMNGVVARLQVDGGAPDNPRSAAAAATAERAAQLAGSGHTVLPGTQSCLSSTAAPCSVCTALQQCPSCRCLHGRPCLLSTPAVAHPGLDVLHIRQLPGPGAGGCWCRWPGLTCRHGLPPMRCGGSCSSGC